MKLKIKLLMLANVLFFTNIGSISAQFKSVADSLDVLNYNININLVHLATQSISGFTVLKLTTKVNNLNQVKLDLLHLNPDSVYLGPTKLNTYNYNDTLLRITLPSALNIGDTVSVTVYYKGHPVIDGSGWGGFYFTTDSSFAYNLGVGFEAQPHSYGRVWFPCIDNFKDRAIYDCYITVKNDKKAVCGGTLLSVIDNGNNTQTFHWKLHGSIPSYLASVAVGNYTAVKDTFNSLSGKVPINIYVRPTDTTNAKGSFLNLKQILLAFENRFGPYRWERVGYVGVPFNSGAMEHSTNIAYPLACINGALTYESLYAHELSHQWFGDLVTCATELDMWINEGWARYCEAVFTESLYGKEAYKTNIRNLHLSVIETAHLVDNGYLAVYGIPAEFTYSNTVYDKGADMIHTLRNYVGDSMFFSATKSMLNTYAFNTISTLQLRDYMSTATGQNLNDFFDAWILSPGFPHFAIDSFKITQTSPQTKVRVWVRQKRNHAPAFANSNRLELTFSKNNWQFFTDTIHFSGQFGTKEFTLPFVPDLVMMDYNEKISDATTDNVLVVKTTGPKTLAAALCNLDVVSVTDSALVRVEHNWVAPDPLKLPNANIKRLSDYHYWKVDGIFPSNFLSKGKFRYNRIVNTTTGNLDNILLPVALSTDSLLLLYRKSPAEDWKITPFIKYGSSSAGYLIVDTLRQGEYAFAVGTPYTAFINKYSIESGQLKVFPNPSNNSFTFSFTITEKAVLKIYNANGNEVDSIRIGKNDSSAKWNTDEFKSGSYFAKLVSDKNVMLANEKLVLIK
ncbi:MAG: M1 family aminopeptidase [Bacteroidota bacterium]